MKATGEFKVTGWSQDDLGGNFQGLPVMKVDAVFDATGEIDGRIAVAYLMFYAAGDGDDPHDGTAQYTGYLAFEGAVNGVKGTFLLEDRGVYQGGVPASSLTVVPASGTGALAGIGGSGAYNARDGVMVIELDYTL